MTEKKKLLVILGAGSSIPCDMPSVTVIDEKMKQWSMEWVTSRTTPAGQPPNFFNLLWSSVDAYYLNRPRPDLGLKTNFEKILGEMLALASWVTPSPFGNALGEVLKDRSTKDEFHHMHEDPALFADRTLVTDQIRYLLERLANFMRGECVKLNKDSSPFQQYNNFFKALQDHFEVGVYNLNYDTVAESVWPEAYSGFNDESFDPLEVASRGEWDFIYPLHGSVHYYFDDPATSRFPKWRDDFSTTCEDVSWTKELPGSDFRFTIHSTLIAGGFKLDQLLADPAQSFHASLVRHVHQADAFLVIGYGFGDAHVNHALANRYALFPSEPRMRAPAIVITKSCRCHGTVADPWRQKYWAEELKKAFNCFFHTTPTHEGVSTRASYFIDNKEFETDTNHRISIWHDGFPVSDDTAQDIIRRLNQ